MGENIKQLYSSLIDQSDRQVNNGITKFDESQGRKILDNNTVTYTSVLEDCIKNKQGKINTKLIPNKYEIMDESNFGKISKNHSFTSDASFERILIFILKGNFLGFNDESNLLSTHELFAHLKKMLVWSKNVDFSDVKGHIHNYARQENIDTNRMKKFLAAMLHYDLDVSALIRFLGLIYQYYRIFLTGNILRRKQAESPKNWTPPRDFFSTFSVVFVCRFRNHLAEMPNNGMNGQPIVRFNQYGGLYDHGRPFPRSKWVLLSLFYESEVYEYGCCSARRLATITGVSVRSALKVIAFSNAAWKTHPVVLAMVMAIQVLVRF